MFSKERDEEGVELLGGGSGRFWKEFWELKQSMEYIV